jgi:hypothetical protein
MYIKVQMSTGICHVHWVRDCIQAMTHPIARRPGLVKCHQIYIRASKYSDKSTICVIRGLVTFWLLNFGLVIFNIICQALHIHAHTHMHTHIYAHIHALHTYAPQACMYMHTHTYAHTHICTHTHMHTHTYAHTHIRTHTYAPQECTHMHHTHIDKHKHIDMKGMGQLMG